MELQVRVPVLPPQCYSPSPDHGYDGRRGVSTLRKPLHESTGNIQHPHMVRYAQHLEALSSIPPSIPAPSVLRTQSLGPEYGAPAYAKSQQRHELHPHGGRRVVQGTNPLMPLLTQAFQNYRKKQADKPDQKWPDVLEGPFLDALLLIPQMRRKKYTMKQTQYGRNMLIGEYLWIAYCQSLPPGAEPDPQMMRERKKVSSHIQVLKNFFSNHRCFHFFFGPRQESKEKDNVETVSLKNNPVLIALSEGRLPDERPNYEYFAQILALNEQVQFRPKRCWIFVSHEDVVVGEDGTGYLPATGGKLSEGEYPHLLRNLERETWAKEEQQFFKGALLHEFTKELHQVESSSVRELGKKWEAAFPDLHQRLKAITSTTTDARCDVLHMHATLELKEKRRFPSGSNLSSWVEISIEQPRLLNHRWKVDTRFVRPPELSYSHDDESAPEVLYEQSKEFTIPYQHRPGCDGRRTDGRGHCDCLAQRCRREGATVPFPVPFPAEVWAQTLTNCAEYPAHPFTDSKRHDRERAAAASRAADEGDEGHRPRRRTKQPTQMDLVTKLAMMQEIWSCPAIAAEEHVGGGSSGDQRWTRRAVILWTFETIHSIDEGKLVTAQGGKTSWRFLTILDPASEYHQRHAIVSGRRSSADSFRDIPAGVACGSRPVSRDAIMSPNLTFQQRMSARLSENLSSAWDSAGVCGGLSSLPSTSAAPQAAYGAHLMSQTVPPPHATAAPAGYGLLDGFGTHSGLATPPPSASLANSFAHSFDSATTGSDILPGYAATTAGLDGATQTLGNALSAVTDPFLAHMGTTYVQTQGGMHDWESHGVGGCMDSAAPWSLGYGGGPGGAHGHDGMLNWAGGPGQTHAPHQSTEHHQHHHHPHLHQPTHPHGHDRQAWAPAASSSSISTCTPVDDEPHDPWTPLTAADHAVGEAGTATRAGSHDHQRHQPHQPHPHHLLRHQQQPQGAAATNESTRGWAHDMHGSSTTASASDLSHDWEEEDMTGVVHVEQGVQQTERQREQPGAEHHPRRSTCSSPSSSFSSSPPPLPPAASSFSSSSSSSSLPPAAVAMVEGQVLEEDGVMVMEEADMEGEGSGEEEGRADEACTKHDQNRGQRPHHHSHHQALLHQQHQQHQQHAFGFEAPTVAFAGAGAGAGEMVAPVPQGTPKGLKRTHADSFGNDEGYDDGYRRRR